MVQYGDETYVIGQLVLQEYDRVHIQNRFYGAFEETMKGAVPESLTCSSPSYGYGDDQGEEPPCLCTLKKCIYHHEKLALIRDKWLKLNKNPFTKIPMKCKFT